MQVVYNNMYVFFRLLWSCCGGKTVKNKDGGDMYQPVKKLDKREKVPCFAPGDIVHFSVKHKRMPRYIHVHVHVYIPHAWKYWQ